MVTVRNSRHPELIGRMLMQDDKEPKGYHDVGGDAAGTIPIVELPWLH
jgi:hypothetical protein